MNTCDKCIKHDICGKREVFGAVGCVDDFQPKPMTNADKIRSMNDEELGKSYRDWETDRKSTRLNSSHSAKSRMPSSA